MCHSCWVDHYHSAAIDNAHVGVAVPLIAAVYEHHLCGGNLHVILDDWNIETEHFSARERRRILKDRESSPERRAAELACFDHMRWLTVAERASALACYDGFSNG